VAIRLKPGCAPTTSCEAVVGFRLAGRVSWQQGPRVVQRPVIDKQCASSHVGRLGGGREMVPAVIGPNSGEPRAPDEHSTAGQWVYAEPDDGNHPYRTPSTGRRWCFAIVYECGARDVTPRGVVILSHASANTPGATTCRRAVRRTDGELRARHRGDTAARAGSGCAEGHLRIHRWTRHTGRHGAQSRIPVRRASETRSKAWAAAIVLAYGVEIPTTTIDGGSDRRVEPRCRLARCDCRISKTVGAIRAGFDDAGTRPSAVSRDPDWCTPKTQTWVIHGQFPREWPSVLSRP